ncbi:MAG: tetratricopeptide repeat protein [Pedobacter sp.]
MKTKCVNCLSVKGKRLCKLKNTALVCPRCCAEIRSQSCSGCSHYTAAERYGIEKMKKRQFRDFIAEINPNVDSEVDKALTFVENGNIAKGEELLIDLIRKHPNLYIVQYGMGTVQAMKGNYSGSIAYFDNCLNIFPYFTEAWFNKGISYKNLLDVGNAIKSLQKVIELGESEDDFVKTAREFVKDMAESIHRDTGLSLDIYLREMDRFDSAFLKMQNREYEEAISGFLKVCESYEQHAQSYGNLGLCYAFLGKKQEALSAFDKALTIDPRYEPAIINRAILLSLKDGEKMPTTSKTVEFYRQLVEEETILTK